jgi:hypothetical protein
MIFEAEVKRVRALTFFQFGDERSAEMRDISVHSEYHINPTRDRVKLRPEPRNLRWATM